MPPARRRTAVFTKHPAPGRVKTRLCPPLSPSQAAALSEAMLRDLVERLAAASDLETALRFAPAAAAAWFAAGFPGLADRAPQVGPDLGHRLARHFEDEARRDPPATAVVVGSDVPLLPVALVREAHAALGAGADLVLSPDGGGGYALVGLRGSHPELFTRVAMSSGDTCARTVALARERGLEVELLEESLDVDREPDLRRLARLLAGRAPDGPGYPVRTALLLRELSLLPA